MHNSSQFNPTNFTDRGIVNFKTYIEVLKRRWPIIVSVIGVVLFVTLMITYTTVPIYSASTQVLIERNRGKSSLESNSYYYEPEFLDTQSEIIKSENVARKVVENLQLDTRYRHYFFDEEEGKRKLFGYIKRKFSGGLNLITQFFSSGESTESNESGKSETIKLTLRNEKDIIAQIIRGGLSVTPLRNTKIVTITYRNKEPTIAKIVVDAVVQAYMDEMLDIKLSTSNYSLKWMTEKAAEEREKLEKTERALQQFMRENDLVTVENKLTVLPQKLSEFGSQLSKSEAKKKELQDLLVKIESTKNPSQLEKISIFASDGVLKSIRERIYKSNQKIQELSKKYGYKHPVMIRAKDELRILKEERRFEINRIVSTVKNSYELAKSKKSSLEDLLSNTKSETMNLNEKFMQYSIMKRDVDANRVLYETLQTSIKQQGVTEQSQSVNIWVVKKGALPSFPSKPNKKLNLLTGLLFGVIGGIGVAVFIEYLDNTITNVQQIEDKFGLTVLGAIEEVKGEEKDIDNYILYNPLSPLAESYRLIRSAFLLSSADQPPKVTLVTSMSKSEGKTATITNLARMLAQEKKKVILVDCDLRRPRMHSLLNMSNTEGLSSYLAGSSDECTILPVPDEEVSLIPSGPIPPDPSELLGSSKMRQLISDLSEQFDFILLDSPPIGAVTDSLTLSQYIDGIILVAKSGSTNIDFFSSGVKKLREINARIFGVVLNSVKVKEQKGYQYGYSTYYAKDDD